MRILLNECLIDKVKELATLDNGFKFKEDKALYLLNLILCGTNDDDEFEETGWVSLCSNILREIVSKDHNKYLDLFVKHTIISKINYCKQCNKCNQFYLIPHWIDDSKLIEYEITDWNLKKKQKSRIMPSAVKRYKCLWKWFDSDDLTLDVDSALQEIENLHFNQRKVLAIKNGISNFINGNKWFIRHNGDKRLHTNLTNMKSEVRKHLKFKGEPLVNIDINSSQIFFLLVLLDKINKNKTKDITEDIHIISALPPESLDQSEFQRFKKLVLTGTFYEVLGNKLISDLGNCGIYEKCKYNHKTNKANYTLYDKPKSLMKPVAFEVIFSKNNQYTKEKSWFKKEFPTIYSIIEKIKEKKYQKLALLLQNIEATAILDKCIKSINRFDNNIPLFTIHDSIMTTAEYVDIVKNIMEKEIFNYTGFTPSISIEVYQNISLSNVA
ncbi:hypothetical protein FUA26_14080 [Seonamhaeicola algicola]|uniref:DNA-directed RNA polymerase n=1 Tax=Seonamhaeicola algicola TaxID=1719036 RepID=A0A5C7AHR4_9FLAO|nr:hypothetical protein [Seonamhaeicola algicola]TXE06105.1 hypothetical protein FUA26_14080 [Seonamhaeicola algicola]